MKKRFLVSILYALLVLCTYAQSNWLYKGEYTNEFLQGQPETVYFYENYIEVNSKKHRLSRTMSNGWKMYKDEFCWGGMEGYYMVGPNYEMKYRFTTPDTFFNGMYLPGSTETYAMPKRGGTYRNQSGYKGTTVNPSPGDNTPRPVQQTTRHECPLCHGKKRIVHNSYPSQYGNGNNTRKYCSECGQYFNASTGHSHITCTQCHGKGYY